MRKAVFRSAVTDLPPQEIVQIGLYGKKFEDVVPLWYGESDQTSPEAAIEAAVASLRAGDTFYAPKNGVEKLREGLAVYQSRLLGKPMSSKRITVTCSGISAIAMMFQGVVGAGDNAVLITPLWPNAAAIAAARGAEPRYVPLRPDEGGRWRLDLQQVEEACDDRTRLIFVNSPNNPTGWMASKEELSALLDIARRLGIWIVADEVYSRIVYDRPVAPSFLQIAEPEDSVLAINSFSKTWAMTGWRLGWITHPPSLEGLMAEIVEMNTSGAAPFVQNGALAAITECEPFVDKFLGFCRDGRALMDDALGPLNNVAYSTPEAAFYAFFKVQGFGDSIDFARRVIREARVGLAPGRAFGDSGEGWLRLCFAQSRETLDKAMDRLLPFIRAL